MTAWRSTTVFERALPACSSNPAARRCPFAVVDEEPPEAIHMRGRRGDYYAEVWLKRFTYFTLPLDVGGRRTVGLVTDGLAPCWRIPAGSGSRCREE